MRVLIRTVVVAAAVSVGAAACSSKVETHGTGGHGGAAGGTGGTMTTSATSMDCGAPFTCPDPPGACTCTSDLGFSNPHEGELCCNPAVTCSGLPPCADACFYCI